MTKPLLLRTYLIVPNAEEQGGRKVILYGGSLVIRKWFSIKKFYILIFFYYIKSKKMGAPRDTRGPQFRPPW